MKNVKKLAGAFAVAAACLTLSGCGSDDAKKAVENLGFTNVDVSYSFWTSTMKCGKDDDFGYDFTATNPQGKTVSGYVCQGTFKGSTVRF